MLKRKLTILFLGVLFTIGGPNIASNVLAETGVYEGDFSCENFKISLNSIVRNGNEYEYNYTVSGGNLPVSKISYLNFGIDEYFELHVTADGNNLDEFIHLPGVGGQDYWLAGVPQLQTITINPQDISESKPLTISASGDAGVHEGFIALYSKAGNKTEYCFIYGPVPPTPCPDLPVDVTVPSTKIVALNDNIGGIFEYCIDINPKTGCPYPDAVPYECGSDPRVYLELDEDFVLGSSWENGDETGPTTPTMIMGEGMDPRCPVAKAAHNPCQWVILSGRPYGPVCW